MSITYLKSRLSIIASLLVIPAQEGIQIFRAFLDACFRGHDGFSSNFFSQMTGYKLDVLPSLVATLSSPPW